MQTPMTLGNMRANGVHSLAIYCAGCGCHHEAVLDVSAYLDDVPVPSFGLRMVCTACGAIGADARPNWNERATDCLFGANAN
jgi:hypothetical protein